MGDHIFSDIFKKPQIKNNKHFDNCYRYGNRDGQFGPSSHSLAAANRTFFASTSINTGGHGGDDHDHQHVHDQYEMNTIQIQELMNNMQTLAQKLDDLADELESFKISIRDNFLNLNGRMLLVEQSFAENPVNSTIMQIISIYPNFDSSIGDYDFTVIKSD